jgi:acyl carrier protein
MTSPQEIETQLNSIFCEVFDDEQIVIARNMTADDIDEWDSMSHIRLVLSVEKVFGVKFSSAEIGALKNVGDFIDLIGRKRQG